MAAIAQPEWISVESYLAGEETAPARHEYIGGAVYAMAGASDEHIAICMNTAFAFREHLKSKPCRVQMSEGKIRVKVSNQDIFYYPDVLVACDPRDTDRFFKRFPKLIVEVLSASTESIDRREKFFSYRQIETLEEYLLIDQRKHELTLFRRSENWQGQVFIGIDAAAELRSIGMRLQASTVYNAVTLTE